MSLRPGAQIPANLHVVVVHQRKDRHVRHIVGGLLKRSPGTPRRGPVMPAAPATGWRVVAVIRCAAGRPGA